MNGMINVDTDVLTGEPDEASETPQHEAAETKDDGDEGVKIGEEFQRMVYDITKEASKEELAYMRDCASNKINELERAEWDRREKAK